MNNLSMALKNLKKNFSFYALYLLSVSFVITVFFAFTSFSMNTVMFEKRSGNGRIEMMCNVISVFLMAFVVFYMSYSNRFFLRRRTKELGVYALLGYRKTTVLSLLTTENLLVCFGAFIVGILLGSFFHKGIVFGITKLLDLSINNSKIPFFNVNAIAKTACFIFAIVIVLMLSNSRFLFKTSLMGLVRFEKSAERKMKFHAVPAIVGFCCIILGYVLALDILRGDKSVWFSIGYTLIAMLTLVLVVVGTILFISSFLPFVVHISKNNKREAAGACTLRHGFPLFYAMFSGRVLSSRWRRTSWPATRAPRRSGGVPASRTPDGGSCSASPARPWSAHRARWEKWRWART